MMSRVSVFWQVFLGILAVALGAVATLGLITRLALAAAFDYYLQQGANSLSPSGRPRMGLRILGAAETTFMSTVDRSVIIGIAVAVGLSVIAAYLIARHLTRPIATLEHAALALAGGDMSQRVDPAGPLEVHALGEAFNRMGISLQEAEELRRRLIADVAHELRNPIAAARAQAEGIAEGVLAPSSERLDSLLEDLEHLSALVEDLQELAVAEAGRLAYEMVDLDMGDLVEREARRAEGVVKPGVAVLVRVMTPPPTVLGDARRLSEVLRNFLGNAARHTSQGSITVSLDATGEDVEVRVTDTGEGIPEADLPYVFERFYRADHARAAHTGGAGLGLAIAARIVRDHGGRVFAERASGGGAVVGFTLPPAPADSQARATRLPRP